MKRLFIILIGICFIITGCGKKIECPKCECDILDYKDIVGSYKSFNEDKTIYTLELYSDGTFSLVKNKTNNIIGNYIIEGKSIKLNNMYEIDNYNVSINNNSEVITINEDSIKINELVFNKNTSKFDDKGIISVLKSIDKIDNTKSE